MTNASSRLPGRTTRPWCPPTGALSPQQDGDDGHAGSRHVERRWGEAEGRDGEHDGRDDAGTDDRPSKQPTKDAHTLMMRSVVRPFQSP
jgi:hypothetical protein